jgi:hypothetical protein
MVLFFLGLVPMVTEADVTIHVTDTQGDFPVFAVPGIIRTDEDQPVPVDFDDGCGSSVVLCR